MRRILTEYLVAKKKRAAKKAELEKAKVKAVLWMVLTLHILVI